MLSTKVILITGKSFRITISCWKLAFFRTAWHYKLPVYTRHVAAVDLSMALDRLYQYDNTVGCCNRGA